jgi:aspartyl/asparaginyl beta-hydroxylase (cupin superfamily)
VDDDDPDLPGYQKFFARERARAARTAGIRCELVVGPPIGVSAAWNELAARAGGDFLLMANDDQLYVEHGWDVAFDERARSLLAEHPDGVFCLYFDGGQYPEGSCDFPILSRRWYATLGYFTPTLFEQWENEQWVFDVARRAGRLFAVPGVFVEHRHYQDYKAPFDETYKRHRLSRVKSLADHAVFVRSAGQREADAERLRGVLRAGSATPPRPNEEAPVTTAAASNIGIGAYTEQAARRYFSHLIDAWNFAGRYDEAHECARLAVQQGLWTDPMQRPREYIRGLQAKPLHDPAGFWFVPYLEENYPKIRAEVEAVLASAVGIDRSVYNTDPDDRTLARQGTWDQAFLYRDGAWQEEVRAHFPVTAGIIAGIPEATTLNPGVVSISRLEPDTHLAAHCGASNALLRVHMGIDVPEGLTLRVGEEITTWQNGRCLIFDDSYEHEVWHRGTRDRVVLILDVLHPQLDGDLSTRDAPRRLASEDEVLSFVRERGLEAIEMRGDDSGDDMVFRPNAQTRAAARRYMRATGATGIRVDATGVRWERPDDREPQEAGR